MHMWTYCTSEHSVVLLPSRSRRWALACLCKCVCACECVCSREPTTHRTQALFSSLPCPSGLVLITGIQSHMKAISIFCRVWVKMCVCVCVCERVWGSGSERECMSLSAISRHLWQSLKGVKSVLACVGGCVCVSNWEKQSVPTARGISLVCVSVCCVCVCVSAACGVLCAP